MHHNDSRNENKNEKIAIVLASNTHWLPFYRKYVTWLKDYGASYEIILWNRESKMEIFDCNYFSYNLRDQTNNRNCLKIVKFILYARYVRQILRRNKYSKIIFMGTYAGLPVLLFRYLKNEYKFNYWIDLRDYTYERSKIYKKVLAITINNAYATAISSLGFLEFLPKSQYLYIHNIDLENRYEVISTVSTTKNYPIRLSFIGNIRYLNINKKLLLAMKNDDRFILQYFGVGSENLVAFCKDNNIRNVYIEGAFPFERTSELYKSSDIINNIYGNDSIEVRTALSNKLYYAAIYKKPILVSTGTFMESIVNQYKLGIGIDINDLNLANHIFDWYNSFSPNESLSISFLEQVIIEEELTKSKFIQFIKR